MSAQALHHHNAAALQPTRPKRSSVSNEQWEQVRPHLKFLYEEQGLTLQQVKTLMANDHGFYATDQMYKKRFAKWEMRKNYTHQVKEQISAVLLGSHTHLNSFDLPATPLSATQLRRIYRHLRRQGHSLTAATVEGAETVRKNVLSGEGSRGEGASSPAQAPTEVKVVEDVELLTETGTDQHQMPLLSQRLALGQDESMRTIEYVLWNTGQYYTWLLNDHELSDGIYDRPAVDAVFIRMRCARRLMTGGHNARAFLMLQLACDGISTLFKTQPFQLLLDFFKTFTNPGWITFCDIRTAVLKQLTVMSRRLLGVGHPLSILMELFANTTTLAEAGPRFLNLLSDTVYDHLGQSEQAMKAQLILVECYMALNELDTAERMCLRCLSCGNPGRKRSLSSDGITQTAFKNLGCIKYMRGLFSEAHDIWLQIYRNDTMFYGGNISGSNAVINCTHLASLYEGQADYTRSAFFYRMAFEGALRTWGPVIVDLHEYFDSLQDTLVKSGASRELSRLLAEHGPTMRKWDARQVEGLGHVHGLAGSLLLSQYTCRPKICDFDAGLHRHFVC